MITKDEIINSTKMSAIQDLIQLVYSSTLNLMKRSNFPDRVHKLPIISHEPTNPKTPKPKQVPVVHGEVMRYESMREGITLKGREACDTWWRESHLSDTAYLIPEFEKLAKMSFEKSHPMKRT